MDAHIQDLVLGVVADAVNGDVNPRRQDLVPAVDAPDEPAATLKGAGAAERVREGGGRGEVFLDRSALDRGRGLGEEVDDVGDFGGRVVHCVVHGRFKE